MNTATRSTDECGVRRLARLPKTWCPAALLIVLTGCDGSPSRNILGSYFPSWMMCALVGLALALAARALFKALGILGEIPAPLAVMAAIGCAGTFTMWLIWLS